MRYHIITTYNSWLRALILLFLILVHFPLWFKICCNLKVSDWFHGIPLWLVPQYSSTISEEVNKILDLAYHIKLVHEQWSITCNLRAMWSNMYHFTSMFFINFLARKAYRSNTSFLYKSNIIGSEQPRFPNYLKNPKKKVKTCTIPPTIRWKHLRVNKINKLHK